MTEEQRPPRWVLTQDGRTFNARAWTRGEARAAFKRLPGVGTERVQSRRVRVRQLKLAGSWADFRAVVGSPEFGLRKRPRLPTGADIRRAGP